MSEDERADLDQARDPLEQILKVAGDRRLADETKKARIQIGYGQANEALNRALALQKLRTEETEHDA